MADLVLPEGLSLAEGEPEALVAAINGAKTPLETANALLAYAHERARGLTASAEEAARTEREAWREAIRSDKEWGGTALQGHQRQIAGLLTEFFGDEGKQFIEANGLFDHPSLFRGFARLAAKMAEGVPAAAQPPDTRPSTSIEIADAWFPSTKGR